MVNVVNTIINLFGMIDTSHKKKCNCGDGF